MIASTRQALDQLQTAAREHATRFNDFKSDWQETLQGNSIIKTNFYQSELMVDEDKFWQNDIARNNTMLQNLAAKRRAFDALVAAAQPCPQPQTATAPPPPPPPRPPANPLAGLPRPTLGRIVLPELPDYFCSFEDRQKWIDTVFNPALEPELE